MLTISIPLKKKQCCKFTLTQAKLTFFTTNLAQTNFYMSLACFLDLFKATF